MVGAGPIAAVGGLLIAGVGSLGELRLKAKTEIATTVAPVISHVIDLAWAFATLPPSTGSTLRCADGRHPLDALDQHRGSLTHADTQRGQTQINSVALHAIEQRERDAYAT